MLNYEFPPIGGGGGQAHLCLLKEYSGYNGLSIDVLTSGSNPGFSVERFADNITIYKVGLHKKNLHYWRKTEVLEWLFKAWFHYRRLLKTNSYDLVHSFFGFPTGWLCYRSAKKLAYIISLRGSDVPGMNPRLNIDYKILAPIFRRIWDNADNLIACSDGLRNRALRFLPKADIEVVPNGVNLQKFRPNCHEHNDSIFRLLTVGRLSASKRYGLLISALKLVSQQYPNVKLTIAGGGKPDVELQWKRVQRGIPEKVVFLGLIPNAQMPRIYQQHDLFVSATAQEGMSNAMLEAMASGLPIVTTRCEGVDELIDGNGIVVEESSAAALAEAIKKVLCDAKTYRQMTIAARQRAKAFSWKRIAEQYFEIYLKTAKPASKIQKCCVS